MLTLLSAAKELEMQTQDWSYRHVWFFLPLFYFVGLDIARRRYR
jgi:hypothetical protein